MNSTRRLRAILVVVWAVTTIPGKAQGGKTTTTSINVTTTIHDYDSTGTQRLLMRSDDYNGTNQASYSNILNANVTSSIYDGSWSLRLYSQSVRTLFITPNNAIDGSQPAAPPAGSYWEDVELGSRCYDQNLNLVPLENILTFSNNCYVMVDFGYNGTEYKLAMGPWLPATGPATGFATVTCNSVSNGRCANWTIIPYMNSGSAHPPTAANLYYYAKGGKLTFIGQYYYTYRIDLTNP